MSFNRKDSAEVFLRLRDNGNWRHYVEMLEAHYSDKVEALLDSPCADEALRGECRALKALLKNINSNQGGLT